MSPLWLRVRAPFAAFRWLQAGVYRASSPTIPPSAAWGLVMNLAGIETRGEGGTVVTNRRADVRACQIAVGEYRPAELSSLYQQLHSYPVGGAGKHLAAGAKGSKYWIAPARREVLVDLDLVVGVRDEDASLASLIQGGLRGELKRYGVPFLGDNNFLIDRVDFLAEPADVFWYCRVNSDSSGAMRDTCRLTIDIDREDSGRTKSDLYQRLKTPGSIPPEAAWTWVPQASGR